MKTVGLRSIVLYILLFAFLGGLGYFTVNLFINGSRWAMQPYNGHIYAGSSSVKLGDITDKDGNILAYTDEESGARWYSDDSTVRKALLHTVGDNAGYISTSIQYTMRGTLSGYNVIMGLNDTPLNSFNRNIELTVDSAACAAAYNALAGHDGAVIVYNYETGDIVCKVSAPTFDPSNVPEDIETNDAYFGAYLDNTLSSSFTPGSIFKIVTAAAAMETRPGTWRDISYVCAGSENIGGSNITCLNSEAHGTQDMYSAMGNSCNIFFARLANDIGAEALQSKAEDMGFNSEFKFGTIPIEESSIELSGTNENQLGWAGVGQYTILTNPYHMMVLMGAVANGGKYVEPTLTDDGSFFTNLLPEDRTLLTSTEAEQIKSLLRSNVSNYYGDWMFPSGLNVCAKTGTGEVGEDKAPNCWIVGFCDNSDYPYAFAAIVEEGVGGIESAGNLMSAVLKALVS